MAFAEKLCDQFGFYNPQGQKQRAGCLKALRELEQADLITLPQPLPQPRCVPSEVGEIGELRLIVVETEKQMRIWNEMMINDHPRGASLLVGRQIRYLVQSDHGWLGGFSFSSAALRLHDRDEWIGWELESKQNNCKYSTNFKNNQSLIQ